jgi:hypothetical protein
MNYWAYELGLRTAGAAVFTLAPETGEGFFTIERLYAPALEVVVAAVERFAYLGQLLQISGHGVFDEVVGGAPGLGGELLQPRFGFWPEVYFHMASLESGAGCVKNKTATIAPRLVLKLPRLHAFSTA